MSKNTEQDNQSRSELVEAIRNSVQTFFAARITALFDKADESIFKQADSAGSVAEQNTLFEFMNDLRGKKQTIIQSFREEIDRYLQPISESPKLPKKKSKIDDDDDQLNLIEQDEMDEMVLLTTLSSKASMDLQEEISHLEMRLEELSTETEAICHKNALAPTRICDVFQAALSDTDFKNEHKRILYRLYGKEVTSQLKDLYDEINQRMIDEDILPSIKLKHGINKNKSETRQQPAQEQMPDNNMRPDTGSAGGAAGGAAGGGMSGGGSAGGGHGGGAGGGAGGSAGGGYSGGASGDMSGGGSAGGGYSGGAGGGYSGGAGGGASGSAGGGYSGSSGGGASGSAGGGYSGSSEGGSAGGHGGGMSGGSAGGGYSGGAGGGASGSAGGGYSGSSEGGSAGGHGGGMSGGDAGEGSADNSSGMSGGSAGGNPGQGSADGNAADNTNSGQRFSAGMPVQRIQQGIRDFVGALPTDSGAAAGGGSGGSSGGFYTHQDVVEALSNMQAQTHIDPEQPHYFDAAAIKSAVLSAIGQQHGGAVTKSVNQVSEKTIDFIKLIFDAIIEDESITDAIKTLILSLQIPVIKTAMLDDDFFIDDQHPSRQLLDNMADAGVGINSHHDLIYIELEKIIKKLLRDFVDNIDAFQVALDEVIQLFEETNQQAEEQQEDTTNELIHAHARNIVLSEIRKITLGKKLPISVHALVLKAWPTLMFNHYLKHGKSNDEWIELLMMLATITESIQPVKSIQELETLGISYDDIVAAVREKLKGYHKPKDVIESIISDLEDTYTELLETEDLPEEDDLPPEEREPEEPYSTSVEEQQEEVDQVKQKLARLPQLVRPGSWFKVHTGEDTIARRLKLGLILVQDATLAFVDYKGTVILEKDADVFADELEQGKSELIMQHSVFDRALNSALSNVEEAPA